MNLHPEHVFGEAAAKREPGLTDVAEVILRATNVIDKVEEAAWQENPDKPRPISSAGPARLSWTEEPPGKTWQARKAQLPTA